MSAAPAATAPIRLRVVRGTEIVNLPELSTFGELREHGFDPVLIAARGARFRDEEAGMPVRRLDVPWMRGRISRTLAGGYVVGRLSPYRYFHEYLQGFDRAAGDAEILCPVDLGHPTSFQSLALRPRAKVALQVWENIPFNWPEDRPLARHFRAVLEQTDLFLPFTRAADRVLALEGVEPSRRTQVYPGIDLQRFRRPTPEERAAARSALGAGPEDVVAAFVGRVEFHKGIFTILEAMTSGDPRIRLHVAGDGRGRVSAEVRARQLELGPRVRFWGPVPHAEVLRRFLWGADLLVGPSIPTEQWREQFGQVYLEAMAAGLPVLAARTGAVSEVILADETGLLVTPDDPDELRQALSRLAGDPALRARLGDAGRRYAERTFDARANAARLAVPLRRLVGR